MALIAVLLSSSESKSEFDVTEKWWVNDGLWQ